MVRSISDSDIGSSRPSLELLDKGNCWCVHDFPHYQHPYLTLFGNLDIPSIAQKKLSRVGTEASNISKLLTSKINDEEDIPTTPVEEAQDSIAQSVDSPAAKIQAPEPRPRILRSASDSFLPTALSSQQMDLTPSIDPDHARAVTFSDTDDVDGYDKKNSLLFQRAHSFTSVPMLTEVPR